MTAFERKKKKASNESRQKLKRACHRDLRLPELATVSMQLARSAPLSILPHCSHRAAIPPTLLSLSLSKLSGSLTPYHKTLYLLVLSSNTFLLPTVYLSLSIYLLLVQLPLFNVFSNETCVSSLSPFPDIPSLSLSFSSQLLTHGSVLGKAVLRLKEEKTTC